MKTYLSFTTLNNIHKHPCFWYNYKLLGIETPTNEFLEAGKKAHQEFAKMITDGKKLPFDLDFQKAEVHFRKTHNDKYLWHGWADGVNYKSKALLELKTVSKRLWINSDVDKSMQPVYYSWVSGFSKVFLLTCKFDLSEPKLYYREYTLKDWQRAEKWALEGIEIIENTDWQKLTCDGSCPHGASCRIYGRNNQN